MSTFTKRVFAPSEAKGGLDEVDPEKTALVLIEYQNEFATVGGKLHNAVKGCMEKTGMLQKSAKIVASARAKGVKIIWVPISFASDNSNNPNKGLGILKGCADDGLFTDGTWNAKICDAVNPDYEKDLIVKGKRGLDAFPGSNLEELLVSNGIETVVLSGFLTNCCVESTMRTAYEKGFNTITLTDCCAATSIEGHEAATGPSGTFGWFSTPMTAYEFEAMIYKHDRVFEPSEAKGGIKVDPKKTALVLIEYQNEFATEGGKMYNAVKDCMEKTGMLMKSAQVVALARAKGMKILLTPIIFSPDNSDNPNKGIGILQGCADDGLFQDGTWNAEFCPALGVKPGDIVVKGKKGLDAFPGSNLEELLVSNGIETVVLSGFLTNCCVESTMRTAYEKGFNTITLTDCCATTSMEGHEAATAPGGTFGLFSTPMTADEFGSLIQSM